MKTNTLYSIKFYITNGTHRFLLKILAFLILVFAALIAIHAPTEASETIIETRDTDLPINIDAIGRGEQVDITLSLRFFDLDLFSDNSQRINEAMARNRYLNWTALGSGLFNVFEVARETDLSKQVALTASNLELFSEPMAVRTLGHALPSEEIPILAIVLVLVAFAVAGIVAAKVFVSKSNNTKI